MARNNESMMVKLAVILHMEARRDRNMDTDGMQGVGTQIVGNDNNMRTRDKCRTRKEEGRA